MECNQQPFFLRFLLNIPPRCMMSTITPQLIAMLTEKQNKQQYESFVTSCLHGGQFDMIVSYKEWLETIRSYSPEEIMAGSEKVRTRKEWFVLLKEVGIDFD